MPSLRDKVLFITGASRGIGLAIALRAARDGARIVIAAKTTEPHPKLPGTIYSAAEDIERAGGQALPLIVDIRHEEQISEAVARTVAQWGGIDICINNASAISLTDTESTPMKRFRPHAPGQHPRHLRHHPSLPPGAQEGEESPRPQPLPAAEHEAPLVCQATSPTPWPSTG